MKWHWGRLKWKCERLKELKTLKLESKAEGAEDAEEGM